MKPNISDEYHALSREELLKHQNECEDFFGGNFRTHTLHTLICIQSTKATEVNIISVKNVNNNNEIILKYSVKSKRIIFCLKDESPGRVATGEVDFPNIDLIEGKWYDIIYRFGKYSLKLWINKIIQNNSDGWPKTEYDFPMEFPARQDKFSVAFGNCDEIRYANRIKLLEHPESPNLCAYNHRDADDDLSHNFHFNADGNKGTLHVLTEFVGGLKKSNNRAGFYTLPHSMAKDVSDFFEDGILRDHSFEMNYRVNKFSESRFSSYLMLLKTSNSQEISITCKPDRQLLVIYIIDGSNKILQTEYFLEQIFNSDWHTLKYNLGGKTFSLYVDGEPMEDYMGRRDICLDYDPHSLLWHDACLMLAEQEPGLDTKLEMDLKDIRFEGIAVTSSNNSILFKQKAKKKGFFASFFKRLGIKKKT